MSEQVIITDPHGKILFINQALEQTTGYRASEAVGKTPAELWGGHMTKEFYARMWHTIKDKKEPVLVKVVNRKKSGELYNLQLTISPILNTAGDILFFVGIEIVV